MGGGGLEGGQARCKSAAQIMQFMSVEQTGLFPAMFGVQVWGERHDPFEQELSRQMMWCAAAV